MIVWQEKLLWSQAELFVSSCSDLLTSKEIVEKVEVGKVEKRRNAESEERAEREPGIGGSPRV